MRELEAKGSLKQEEQIEIVKQDIHKKELKFLGSTRKIPGLILWEFNKTDKTITQATFKKVDYVLDNLKRNPDGTLALAGPIKIRSKVETKENCIYVQALNKQNAMKVLKRNKLIS